MLSLTRRPTERIVIIVGDQEVWITVNSVRGNQVALGFDADDEVIIHREEVYNRGIE